MNDRHEHEWLRTAGYYVGWPLLGFVLIFGLVCFPLLYFVGTSN